MLTGKSKILITISKDLIETFQNFIEIKKSMQDESNFFKKNTMEYLLDEMVEIFINKFLLSDNYKKTLPYMFENFKLSSFIDRKILFNDEIYLIEENLIKKYISIESFNKCIKYDRHINIEILHNLFMDTTKIEEHPLFITTVNYHQTKNLILPILDETKKKLEEIIFRFKNEFGIYYSKKNLISDIISFYLFLFNKKQHEIKTNDIEYFKIRIDSLPLSDLITLSKNIKKRSIV